MSIKKNCHNCKYGSYDSDGDYGEYSWFECSKRLDDGKNNLDKNLAKDSYLEKAKVCCEPMVVVTCKICGDKDMAHEKNDGFLCFPCWIEARKTPEDTK